jgi:hypothetical protein
MIQKLKRKSTSKTVSWWKIIFVIEHVRSNEEECAPEDRSLPAKGSPLLETPCAAGEYCLVQCVCGMCFVPVRFEVFTAVLLQFSVI